MTDEKKTVEYLITDPRIERWERWAARREAGPVDALGRAAP